MKRSALFILSLCMLLITCSDSDDPIKEIENKDPFITLKKTNINFSNEGGSEAILIESNVTWTAKSYASWCTVSPSSGNKSTGSITLSAPANEEYKDRICAVMIEGGGVTKTITVNQRSNESRVYLVDKMGALGTILNQTQKDTITTMIVKGEINKADFEVMKKQMPKLKYLNLKDVKCEGDKIPDAAFGEYDYNYANANKNINTIILPESITTIGENAFSFCSGLTGNLNLPDGLTTIGEMAFVSCSGFTGNLIIPGGVTAIESGAFAGCSGFTGNLNLPDGLTTIGDGAFMGCSGFTGDLNLPDGLTTIESGAFSGCSGFTGNLNLPDGIKTIGGWAFAWCSGFTGNLIIPDGVTTIEPQAFMGCTGFTGNLNLPDGVTTIGMSAFQLCTGFTGLTIGKNVTTINERAFYGCSNIAGDVVFPESLSSIRIEGFKGCNNVDAFQFPHTTPLGYYKDMLEMSVPVKVPNEAVSAYQSAYGWKEHTIIGY